MSTSLRFICLLLLPLVLLSSCSGKKLEDRKNSKTWRNGNAPIKALLASRFNGMESFEKKVKVEYKRSKKKKADGQPLRSKVILTYTTDHGEIKSVLKAGLSQDDIQAAKNAGKFDQALFAMEAPFAVRNRNELKKVYLLARRRQIYFGENDVAFYDLAELALEKLSTPAQAYLTPRDSSEKGYINSFNHIAAQAFLTTLFSEELADFVADVHELHNMPELATGLFSEAQLNDTVNYPLENYIDMLNNEVGQELGKELKKKYQIHPTTKWTTKLLASYLNDLQDYYAWSYGIGFKPVREDDLVVRLFSVKLNKVMAGFSDR